jgi:hypothetical protein
MITSLRTFITRTSRVFKLFNISLDFVSKVQKEQKTLQELFLISDIRRHIFTQLRVFRGRTHLPSA